MTGKEAKELAIKKWEIVIEHNGSDWNLHRELPREIQNFKNECSYCELFMAFYNGRNICNKNCPLFIKNSDWDETRFIGVGCRAKNHPYHIWCEDESKENAIRILELIKNSPEPNI